MELNLRDVWLGRHAGDLQPHDSSSEWRSGVPRTDAHERSYTCLCEEHDLALRDSVCRRCHRPEWAVYPRSDGGDARRQTS
jgi:hypothetical protein